MVKLSWIVTTGVLALAASPIACFIGGDDNGHTGYYTGTGAANTGTGTNTQSSGTQSGTGGGHAALKDTCNPVTNAGCADDGTACDYNGTTFQCYPPPNSVDVCGACDNSTAFCGAELTCVIPNGSAHGACFRYCCSDDDCGTGATCDTNIGASYIAPAIPSDKIGLCVHDGAASCGPASPKSGGSCIGGYQPANPASSSAGSTTGASTSGSSGSHSSSGGSGGSTGHGGSPGTDGGPGAGGAGGGGPGAPDAGHAGRPDGG